MKRVEATDPPLHVDECMPAPTWVTLNHHVASGFGNGHDMARGKQGLLVGVIGSTEKCPHPQSSQSRKTICFLLSQ